MSKCVHNQQIRYFCTKWTCQYPTIGGCLKCFKQEHKHSDGEQAELIDVEELNRLMLKYSFSSRIKPECVNLQESFYSFFKKIQNQLKEIVTTVDEICKNVVNNIGFPYICFKNYFTVFKRIKNKQYNRLPSAQFRKFVSQTRATSTQKLSQLQQKLYLKQINNCHQMIKQIDHMIGSFQNVTKYYEQKTKFIHDNSQYMKNKEIVERIKNQLKNNNQYKNQQKTANYNLNINLVRKSRTISQQQPSKKFLGISPANENYQYLQAKSNKKLNIVKPMGSLIPNKNELVSKSSEKERLKEMKISMTEFTGEKQVEKLTKEMKISSQFLTNKEKRSTSIDAHLPKNMRLQQKINKLKLQKKQRQGEINQEDLDVQQQKNMIRNNNLPGGDEKLKTAEKNHEQTLEIVPIIRRLNRKLYDNQLGQNQQSPLIKNIIKSKIIKIGQKSQPISPKQNDRLSPDTKQSLEKSKNKKNNKSLNLKLEKIKDDSLQLTELEEKSFLAFVDSIKVKTTSAIPMLEKSIQQCSKNLSAVEYLSYLYLESNQFLKCISLCTKYLSLIASNKNLHQQKTLLLNNKASALNNIGRYSQTVKLLEGCPNGNQTTMKNLANGYLGVGMLEKAITLYKELLEENSDDEVLYNLSSCYYLSNDLQAAKQMIGLAVSAQPHKKQYLELQNHIVGMARIGDS